MENILGTDIQTTDNDIQFTANQDFKQVSGFDNLSQAIKNRLDTVIQEYFVVDYGSELHKIVGQPYNNLVKNRIIGFVNETLLQDPRIEKILEVTISNSAKKDSLLININVKPRKVTTSLNLVYNLFVTI